MSEKTADLFPYPDGITPDEPPATCSNCAYFDLSVGDLAEADPGGGTCAHPLPAWVYERDAIKSSCIVHADDLKYCDCWTERKKP
jgi:hypothetical protein